MSNIKRRSFYISLGVCALAIGAAGFSTYKSIKDFSSSERKKNSYMGAIKKKKTPEEIPKKNIVSSIKESNPISSIANEISKPVSAKVSDESFSTPMEYTKVSKYDNELKYSDRFKDWRKNDGIDLTGSNNSDVYSISDGKVVEVLEDPSYGKTIRVMHKGKDNDDILASYCDLNDRDLKLKRGDLLKKGQKISTLRTNTLHLTMKKKNEMIDPCKVLGIKQ